MAISKAMSNGKIIYLNVCIHCLIFSHDHNGNNLRLAFQDHDLLVRFVEVGCFVTSLCPTLLLGIVIIVIDIPFFPPSHNTELILQNKVM
jgi:hypothetical protein